MAKFNYFLDLIVFEIKYSFGHLYWDRSGQTILDIETECEGWFNARDDKNTSRLENPEKRIALSFSDHRFNLSIDKPKSEDLNTITLEIHKTWKIVKANLGLEDYDKLGCRFYYVKPTRSIVESEKLLKRSKFNLAVPYTLNQFGYELNVRHLVGIFEKNNMEYRVELKGITRAEGINPAGLLEKRPSAMSKRKNQYRLKKMEQVSNYSKDPMYAVMLDVDCVEVNPEDISTTDFFNAQLDTVQKDLLPILGEL